MQQVGSEYGFSPEMAAAYAGTASRAHMLDQLQQQQQTGDAAAATLIVEAASPISSRPPAGANFDEFVPGPSGFPSEDALAGEDVERGTASGNRWPRQETLVLLKIRSEMDAAFREATPRGPLWEDIARKLAELGYKRSAKKCREKFENVQKYYKRTKEGRVRRQEGKNYRFFSQLEALYNTNNTNFTSTSSSATPAIPISIGISTRNPMVGSSSPERIQTPTTISTPPNQRHDLTTSMPVAGISGSTAPALGNCLSSNTSSSSGSEEEETEEGLNMGTRKRKRMEFDVCGRNKKMMDFFERVMEEVIEKQEAMLQRFLVTMEKREQDRMMMEEAWRRQEVARLSREQEIIAQERALAASRDATLIAFLQKMTGQSIQIAVPITIPAVSFPQKPSPPPPPPPQPQYHHHHHYRHHHQQQQEQQKQPRSKEQEEQSNDVIQHQMPSSENVVVQQENQEAVGGNFDSTSSRWPKPEVLALIKLRSGLESRYQEAGPKGPLWEDISAQMRRAGYNRSAKRCKEKWENINKYFKKMKESNKKRREDAKTCPYYQQLDELYSKKLLPTTADIANINKQEEEIHFQNSNEVVEILPPQQTQTTIDVNNNSNSNSSNKNGGNIAIGGTLQIQSSNRGLVASFFEEVTVKEVSIGHVFLSLLSFFTVTILLKIKYY